MDVVVTNFSDMVNSLVASANGLATVFFATSAVQYVLGVVIGIGFGLGVVLAWTRA